LQIRIPICFQDERLSSFGAEQKLQEIGLSRGKKRQRLDALAAAEILQAFLECKQSGQAISPPGGEDVRDVSP
jgi:RNase H-fold protein (predicted Holliday junction resolvase)